MDNGQHKPILAAWKQALISEYQFEMNGQMLTIRYQSVDVMDLMASEAGNPLMGALQGSMAQGADASVIGAELMKKPEDLTKVFEMLNKLLVKAIVEPPLVEQGNEDGIPLAAIPYTVKMELFSRLIGGGTVDPLEQFRQKPPKSMVAR